LCADEKTVLEAVIQWARRRAKETKQEFEDVVRRVIQSVRLPLLSTADLSEVANLNVVDDTHLIALYTHASTIGDDRKLPEGFPYSSVRRKGALTLKYTAMWDMKGVFSYIGTKGFTKAWENPFLSGDVFIDAKTDGTFNSSAAYYPLPHGSGESKQVLSWVIDQKNTTTTCCSATAAPWFIVDLKRFRLRPNRVTVRQNYSGNYIYGWTLSCSNDKSTWTTLKTDTGSGSASQLMHEFDKPQEYFRYFKVWKNSSQVLLSGWEMYGDIKKV
jgi:hypothetical protein